MLKITNTIHIDETDIDISFTKSSGPGGQNVNKVETAVQLRYDARHSRALSNAVFLRLKTIAGSRMTSGGVILITANSFRTQERNRKDAHERLVAMIQEAAIIPKHRRVTKPSKNAKAKRVDTKKQRGETKKGRGRVSKFDY